MSENHTPEPWSVAEESFDNDGIQESVIRGMGGRAAIAVTLDFGPNNPAMREANARRIVACVNACAGVDAELLENYPAPFSELRKQRDELLATITKIRALPQHRDAMKLVHHYADQALEKANGEAEEGAT